MICRRAAVKDPLEPRFVRLWQRRLGKHTAQRSTELDQVQAAASSLLSLSCQSDLISPHAKGSMHSTMLLKKT